MRNESSQSIKNKRRNTKRWRILIVTIAIFLIGLIGGYIYFSKVFYKFEPVVKESFETVLKVEDFFSLRMYYPVDDHLQFEERRILKRNVPIAIAEATVEEFLKGPAGVTSTIIPKEAKLRGLYIGGDRILYVDLSEEFRRNFQGDALSELLILKGLYESLISNVEDIYDVKILIEGREVESLGGHFYLLYPLKDTVSF